MKTTARWSACLSVLCCLASAALASSISPDEARKACRRNFGATSEFIRIEESKGLIYCKSRRETEKIRIGKPAGQPGIEGETPAEGEPVPEPPEGQLPGATVDCTSASSGDCAVETTKLDRSAQPPSDRQILMENAKRVCVGRFGPSSTVHHLDFNNWQIMCNVPEK